MKFYLTVFALFFLAAPSFAEDQPTLAATPAQDNTKSVLSGETAATMTADVQKCCNINADKKVIYKNRRNIAPCAVQQNLNLSYCQSGVDACCNKVSYLETVEVPACVPPCACKDDVTVSRDGKRVVHDYGRYEVVLKSRRDGAVEVNYRKRLLNR